MCDLLQNAVEATNVKEEITVHLEEQDKYTSVSVSNTGSEIPDTNISNIFEPFFTEGKDDGTGLGLAICKKIINDHGGEIYCNSDSQKTVFTFTIPRYVELVATKPRPKASRVAVVDDCPFIRDMWAKQASNGFSISTFSSPEEFLSSHDHLSSLTENELCIVTDYYFEPSSKVNGLEFGQELREKGFTGGLYLSTDASVDSNLVLGIDAVLIDKQPSKAIALLNI